MSEKMRKSMMCKQQSDAMKLKNDEHFDHSGRSRKHTTAAISNIIQSDAEGRRPPRILHRSWAVVMTFASILLASGFFFRFYKDILAGASFGFRHRNSDEATTTAAALNTSLSSSGENSNRMKKAETPESSTSPLSSDVKNSSRESGSSGRILEWARYPAQVNETDSVLGILKDAAAGEPCYRAVTHHAHVFGLPVPQGQNPTRLTAGPAHELLIVSFDVHGKRRCAGGDYYEVDLSGTYWKSRPPLIDLNDGSYRLQLQIDPRFAGLYSFKVILAYSNFHGLDWVPIRSRSPWFREQEIFNAKIAFVVLASSQSDVSGGDHGGRDLELKRCRTRWDFKSMRWSGRWTREQFNESCAIGNDGRFVCLDPEAQCERPWCEGPVGRLESNGWVYSAHCSFRILSRDEAWDCLDGKWLLLWGDSNHQDTVRNLLNFVLGCPTHREMARRYDLTFNRSSCSSSIWGPDAASARLVNRSSSSGSERRGAASRDGQSVRITNIFNGHHRLEQDNEGLRSLADAQFRGLIESYFAGERVPDAVVLNSGLHDANFWRNTHDYVTDGVRRAAQLWQGIFERVGARSGAALSTTVIYRHTVAGGGTFRAFDNNPQKLEVYTRLLAERLGELDLPNFRIVDDFDMTFPWHYDHSCTDGLHYGRPPSKSRWVDGRIGHQYFVDLMLVHVLLNLICLE